MITESVRMLVSIELSISECKANKERESLLRSLMEAALQQHYPVVERERRQVQSAEPGAVMYLPLGGSNSVR